MDKILNNKNYIIKTRDSLYNYQYDAGVKNEISFANYLDGKRFKELNPVFQMMIVDLFGEINDNSLIKAYKNEKLEKCDIFIKINEKTKEVSIKMGNKNSMHVERISDFIHFLIRCGVSRNTIIEYLKFHYADGTTNGKGKNRISVEDYKKVNQFKIDLINEEINQKNIILKAIDRFVLKGIDEKSNIDLIIHGTLNDFVWITKEDIKKVAISKINDYSSTVHFGPLTCQPLARCLNYNSGYENKRYCIQIKWYNLVDDIIENSGDNTSNRL